MTNPTIIISIGLLILNLNSCTRKTSHEAALLNNIQISNAELNSRIIHFSKIFTGRINSAFKKKSVAEKGQIPVYHERDGVVAVEAEDFHAQQLDGTRMWYLIDQESDLPPLTDLDDPHYETASGKAYLEILPDTRVTHDDTLKHGINFTNEAGKMAVLNYRVYFDNPGKYYVWVRAFSTGSEDNGIHVGIDGTWPESGQRMQWCEGKNTWTWDSKQRTTEVHCGVPELIWLDIPTTGVHTISFSMREDGFEFDKWMMSRTYQKPEGFGPAPVRKN